jgi:predicted anti-sigma-YlaC factor YlaD
MNCGIHEDAIVDRARSTAADAQPDAALAAHLAECIACRTRLAGERQLTEGLRALSEAARDARAPQDMEARLLEVFGALHPRRGGREAGVRAREWPSWLATAAAATVIVAGLMLSRQDFERRHGTGTNTGQTQTAAASSDFVPWPGAAALPAFESGQLVRTELPASVLPLLGIAPEARSGDKVMADVLIGQDGLARAVRLAR